MQSYLYQSHVSLFGVTIGAKHLQEPFIRHFDNSMSDLDSYRQHVWFTEDTTQSLPHSEYEGRDFAVGLFDIKMDAQWFLTYQNLLYYIQHYKTPIIIVIDTRDSAETWESFKEQFLELGREIKRSYGKELTVFFHSFDNLAKFSSRALLAPLFEV